MNKSLLNKSILVLMGGESSEREVSLSSGKNVLNSLIELGFRTKSLDCSGNFIPKLRNIDPDICFNALHGKGGEDGKIQGLLESEGIPYTHSGVYASSLAMNKAFSKELFKKK
jgi:D-alanine-D-alanine ligase